MHQKFQIINQI